MALSELGGFQAIVGAVRARAPKNGLNSEDIEKLITAVEKIPTALKSQERERLEKQISNIVSFLEVHLIEEPKAGEEKRHEDLKGVLIKKLQEKLSLLQNGKPTTKKL